MDASRTYCLPRLNLVSNFPTLVLPRAGGRRHRVLGRNEQGVYTAPCDRLDARTLANADDALPMC
jgi:hypothetical protein